MHETKPAMVDAGIMTEPWQPEQAAVPVQAVDTALDPDMTEESSIVEEEPKTPVKGLGERLVGAAGGALAGFGLGRISKEKTPEPEAAGDIATPIRADSETLPASTASFATPTKDITAPTPAPTLSFAPIIAQDYEPLAVPVIEPQSHSTPVPPKRSSKRIGSSPTTPIVTELPVPIELEASPVKTPTTRSLSQGTAVVPEEPEREFVEPAVYGGGKGANGIPTLVFGDEPDAISTPVRRPMQEISPNVAQGADSTTVVPLPIVTPLQPLKHMQDGGSQTVVSGQDIDNMMRDKSVVPVPVPVPAPVEEIPRSPVRPGSAGSARQKVSSPIPTPPLPPDHTEKIAAAAKTPVPTNVPGSMGPPLLPASAYRGKGQSRLASAVYEACLETINDNHLMYPDDIAPATDPRMIQAITQTMIGEYLWKYTRKAGRVEKSSTRHRRFFWVHPYTRTLYWSEQDPSTTTKGMMKAKSVPIEAVRVITDDNVNPPGAETEADDAINGEDIEEFNPAGFSFRRSISKMTRGRSRSRVSLASRTSRVTRNESPTKLESAIPEHQSATAGRSQSSAPAAGSISSRRARDSSRFSTMASRFSTVRGSSVNQARAGSALSSRGDGEVYNSSLMSESAEDVRQAIERQDQGADMLENVRACCDGKHDVGSLSKAHKHTSLRARLSASHHHAPKAEAIS
ncbi:hypothetical protein AMS68_005834 [Peltaster fructicola]|uniref:Pleckstrin homology domain-containing protein n=1 Tax=Peltaster fructicola TaxID=286661 RepID=A0A6H0XZY6_9PEZI|nr:hypothetical protein AMS68_005834 [Peltaster fructicola]